MANLITSEKADPPDEFMMNNGLTSVFFEVLVLAGSSIAETDWEKQLVCWLAEHDQNVFGNGMVGFDLDEIAWDREDFIAQKEFLGRVIQLARARRRWELLSYTPREERIDWALGELRRLLDRHTLDLVESEKTWPWRAVRGLRAWRTFST